MASAAEQLAANLNFGALAKSEDLKSRIWFTLGALIVYRLGTYIPIPGIDTMELAKFAAQNTSGILGWVNGLAGGALGRMAIFALNIMPYISASIIIQLMTTVSPHLEALKKEGESGRKKMNQYTRYGTVVLAALQAYGIAVGLEGQGNLVSEPGHVFPRQHGYYAHGRHGVPDVAGRADYLARHRQRHFADHFCRHCGWLARRHCGHAGTWPHGPVVNLPHSGHFDHGAWRRCLHRVV